MDGRMDEQTDREEKETGWTDGQIVQGDGEGGRDGWGRPGRRDGGTDSQLGTGRQGWRDRWPVGDREKGMGERWRERWSSQEKASPWRGDSRAEGRGRTGDPGGDRRGGQERGALGTWTDGAPQWGGTGDRGTERSVHRDAPAWGEEQGGDVPKDRASPSPRV